MAKAGYMYIRAGLADFNKLCFLLNAAHIC